MTIKSAIASFDLLQPNAKEILCAVIEKEILTAFEIVRNCGSNEEDDLQAAANRLGIGRKRRIK